MPQNPTATEFLASLPPPLTRKGSSRATMKEVTVRIREECNQAIKQRALPADTKISVRTPDYGSITIEIVAWAGAVHSPEYAETIMDPSISWDGAPGQRFTAEINAAHDLLEKIANRHNYDNSDSRVDHFDVGFYLTVKFDYVANYERCGIRAEHDSKYAELVQRAHSAAAIVGPKATIAMCPDGIEASSDWALEKLVRSATSGRTLVHHKRLGWIPESQG